jgi:hypothetical protein
METSRSLLGMISVLAGGAISWSSKCQTTAAQSTLEAKYNSATAATRDVLWLRKMMEDFKVPPVCPTTIYCNNQGAIATSKDDMFHPCTKHIAMKFHLVREKTEEGDVVLYYVPTAEMVADFLTKSLPREKLERLLPLVGLGPPLDPGGVLKSRL